MNSYRQLQKFFSLVSFLIHFSINRKLYIDINAFKRREFEIMIYHIKFICLNSNKSKRIDIEFILFFNRIFNEAEKKYWFIELKMIDLMWIIRRVRHMIEATKKLLSFSSIMQSIFLLQNKSLSLAVTLISWLFDSYARLFICFNSDLMSNIVSTRNTLYQTRCRVCFSITTTTTSIDKLTMY